MMNYSRISLQVLLGIALGVMPLCGFLLSSTASAQEVAAWADVRMTVRDGLLLWCDASRLNEALQAEQSAEVRPGMPVEYWPDASPARRRFKPSVPDQAPIYQATGSFKTLTFDGINDCLVSQQDGLNSRHLSLFVVAAPYSHRQLFSAVFASSHPDRNDYVVGVNLDQGVSSQPQVHIWNVEGSGSQGMQNLMRGALPFGSVMRLGLTIDSEDKQARFYLNGEPQGSRDWRASNMAQDLLVLGARYYTNGGPPEVRGFFDGEIAEVIAFNRLVSERERQEIEAYLDQKYGEIAPLQPPQQRLGTAPLVRLEQPPAVQMFVPGFEVRELPVSLSNVNNLLYRNDGKLVALGYDGNIHLLTDTDGDGIEDKSELYWDNQGRVRAPIGMALTPPGYPHGKGVVVAAKGQCVLIRDTNGDDRADEMVTIASGWKELPHGVDALGVDIDPRDFSIYFGLGTESFVDAYGVGRDPNRVYPINDERGTIMRIAPDLKSREIVATGIRFPVAIRFNSLGDLFCTDQEGATWLPNGNPFDELLHIERGRHYGFPPRHPKHLPQVIDEPSVFDYVPQHQSTCGLSFNTAKDGQPIFGPSIWRDDAFVVGYSRGKLYRTKLVKSAAGYVAQNQLIGSLSMLPSDVCMGPAGQMILAAHSGGPDWGSGPSGAGKLYQVRYAQPELPQPVALWPAGPQEVQVAFNRELSDEQLKRLGQQPRIVYGRYASAGDRFEVLWPGYQVVQDQQATPRNQLNVHQLTVAADRRSVLVRTAAHPEQSVYALTMSSINPPTTDAVNGVSQVNEIDLAYDLHGVQAIWQSSQSQDTANTTSIWLPHCDLKVGRAFLKESADHDRFWSMIQQPGTLSFDTWLDLHNLLRPEVQPGATLSYRLSDEQAKLQIKSQHRFTVKLEGREYESEAIGDGQQVKIEATAAERLRLQVTLATDHRAPELLMTWSTGEDSRQREFSLRRFTLPWVPKERTELVQQRVQDLPELKGGNWTRGRRVFFDQQLGCAKCHAVRGEGGNIGPDLSNLPLRDLASVKRDIEQPSYAINPDYITQQVLLADGRLLQGTLRTADGQLIISDTKGTVTKVDQAEVEEVHAARLSIMPEGLAKQLGADGYRDLLVYLLTPPPHMTDYGPLDPPSPRSSASVGELLAGSEQVDRPERLRVALIYGPKDHGPGEHDYPVWVKQWSDLLSMADQVEVSQAESWPTEEQLANADVIVFYQQGRWSESQAKQLDAYLARGGGLVYIHYAVDGGAQPDAFAERIGLAWQGGRSKFRHGPLSLSFDQQAPHPITRNFTGLELHDESYWQLVGDVKRIHVLGSGAEDGVMQPLFWTCEPQRGRVFVSIPGHFAWSFDDPHFRILLLRGICWAGRQPVDRLNDLVTPGARMQ